MIGIGSSLAIAHGLRSSGSADDIWCAVRPYSAGAIGILLCVWAIHLQDDSHANSTDPDDDEPELLPEPEPEPPLDPLLFEDCGLFDECRSSSSSAFILAISRSAILIIAYEIQAIAAPPNIGAGPNLTNPATTPAAPKPIASFARNI